MGMTSRSRGCASLPTTAQAGALQVAALMRLLRAESLYAGEVRPLSPNRSRSLVDDLVHSVDDLC